MDIEIGIAIQSLFDKLKTNKVSYNINFSLASPDFPATTLADFDILDDKNLFTDSPVKCKLELAFDRAIVFSKRPRFCRLSPHLTQEQEATTEADNMGRRSKGNSNNELGRVKGWESELSQPEVLRMTAGMVFKTPTTFSEAALMAQVKMKEWNLSCTKNDLDCSSY